MSEQATAATTAERRQVIDGLKSILVNDLDIRFEEAEIEETTRLVEEGLALDSVVIAELITFIESRFDFQFDDVDMNTENFRDLNSLADLVISRVQGGESPK